MRSKPSLTRLLVVFTLIAIGSLSIAYAHKGYSAMSETEDFQASSATHVFKHTIVAPWTAARLKVNMRVEHGTADVRLFDATGAIRWEKTFASRDVSVDETFSGQGKWRVELRLKNATGSYAVHLIAV